MSAAKPAILPTRQAREYPTEWTCYSGDEEDEAQHRQQAADEDEPRVEPGYSGSGWPLVSGANGSAARPTRKTAHMVMPA